MLEKEVVSNYDDRFFSFKEQAYQLKAIYNWNVKKAVRNITQWAADIWARLKIFAVDIWATALVVIWATNFNGHLYFQVDVW
jgi:predicted signal transduction protein with EAL and GGDEF domain